MKFIYQLLIFLLIFSAVIGMLGQFFPGTTGITDQNSNPIDSDQNIRKYEGVGDGISIVMGMFASWETLAIFGAIFAAGGLFSKFAGGSINIALLLGVSIFIATLTSVWTFAMKTINHLNYTNNTEVLTIFIIVNICVGVITVFTVVDLLTGQQGVDT